MLPALPLSLSRGQCWHHLSLKDKGTGCHTPATLQGAEQTQPRDQGCWLPYPLHPPGGRTDSASTPRVRAAIPSPSSGGRMDSASRLRAGAAIPSPSSRGQYWPHMCVSCPQRVGLQVGTCFRGSQVLLALLPMGELGPQVPDLGIHTWKTEGGDSPSGFGGRWRVVQASGYC